jgi:hypothetical protein
MASDDGRGWKIIDWLWFCSVPAVSISASPPPRPVVGGGRVGEVMALPAIFLPEMKNKKEERHV